MFERSKIKNHRKITLGTPNKPEKVYIKKGSKINSKKKIIINRVK